MGIMGSRTILWDVVRIWGKNDMQNVDLGVWVFLKMG
jgi:hypothetical protein